ncbi:MAG: c-type cytochrome [Gammaproteobacteria bacterium]|nr:c-type cytochrome [Gammaproteobacteria bacterium]
MSKSVKRKRLCAVFISVCLASLCLTVQAEKFSGIGRPATSAEIKAWDIDVRPDLKGLPVGKGTAVKGEPIWEAKCTSCHGTFGEYNEVFTPLVGYTTQKDIETGRVQALSLGSGAPNRTTLMKVSEISTLWDYINRAMPWNAPKSLSPDEVYSVLAYMLNLGDIIPVDYELNERTMADVQKRLPNRNGTTRIHGKWPGKEFGGNFTPDVQGSSCLKNCKPELKIVSQLPDHARNAHGNLATQMRTHGPVRGQQTEGVKVISTSAVGVPSGGSGLTLVDVDPLLQKYTCTACHSVNAKLVGPAFKEIVAKQGKRADALSYLAGKIKSGGEGVYGQIPMPAQTLSDAEAEKIANWLVQGGAK